MNNSLARVPCTVVTGFLGAGKTTLIRHVLANARGRRLAIIVNEFGDVGIDGEILKGCGDAGDHLVVERLCRRDVDARRRQRVEQAFRIPALA